MNLSLLRSEIWRALGEPTDLDPATDVSYNGGPLLTFVVNEAQRQIAKWKDPDTGIRVWIPTFINSAFFSSVVRTNSIVDVNNSGFPYSVALGLALGTDIDDRYNGWVLEITSGDAIGETRLVVDSTYGAGGTRLFVHEAFDVAPVSGDALKLYKNFFPLYNATHNLNADGIVLPAVTDTQRATGNLLDILKITDVALGRELEYAERAESFPEIQLNSGDPSQWMRIGNNIVFDLAVSENKWFKMEYLRFPTELAAAADVPEIPEIYHYALVLWGIWWGYVRSNEPARQAAAMSALVKFIRSTQNPMELKSIRNNPGGYLEAR